MKIINTLSELPQKLYGGIGECCDKKCKECAVNRTAPIISSLKNLL
jgi:hypothetical protein